MNICPPFLTEKKLDVKRYELLTELIGGCHVPGKTISVLVLCLLEKLKMEFTRSVVYVIKLSWRKSIFLPKLKQQE